MPRQNRRRRHSKTTTQTHTPFFKKQDTARSPFFSPPLRKPTPRLTLGKPNDALEKAANAKASAIVNHTQAQSAPQGVVSPMADNEKEPVQAMTEQEEPTQAMEEEEPAQAMEEEEPAQAMEEEEPAQTMEEEEPAQAMAAGEPIQTRQTPAKRKSSSGGSTISPDISQRIQQSRGKGSPLPPNIQEEMSKAFNGYDFSGVIIHTDSEAADLCKALNAQAFTRGKDIYFNQGKYNPNTPKGKFLLAHELTHVPQQEKMT